MSGSEFVDKVREYLLSTGEEAHGVGIIPRYKYLFIFFILGIIIFCSKLNILLVLFKNQILYIKKVFFWFRWLCRFHVLFFKMFCPSSSLIGKTHVPESKYYISITNLAHWLLFMRWFELLIRLIVVIILHILAFWVSIVFYDIICNLNVIWFYFCSNPDQSKHLETARMRLLDLWIDFVNLRSEDYSENSRIPTMV